MACHLQIQLCNGTRCAEGTANMQAQTATPKKTYTAPSPELYGVLGALGERMFLEAMSLCDDEKEAAAWASANLIRSLEERRLLARLAAIR
jgi:hypothetical protein